MSETKQSIKKKSYLIDMDGVLVQGDRPIPGAKEFIQRLIDGGHKFLVLTNNSRYTQQDLQHRLQSIGVPVSAEHFFSSAMATAKFLKAQKPSGSAFVLGGTGLYQALNEEGYKLTDYNPDFMVLGETDSYSYDKIIRASQLLQQGIPFIATNPDPAAPGEDFNVPACGAVAALLEKATGYSPYFVGKPNPLVMRLALRYLDEHSENAVMIGDRMETDVKVGLESGLETILVLSGLTSRKGVLKFPYRPSRIVESVAELEP